MEVTSEIQSRSDARQQLNALLREKLELLVVLLTEHSQWDTQMQNAACSVEYSDFPEGKIEHVRVIVFLYFSDVKKELLEAYEAAAKLRLFWMDARHKYREAMLANIQVAEAYKSAVDDDVYLKTYSQS